ncbi:MAG: serine hydrolase domain-containing protein [Bacteroidales bacterium]|nr:serine hydrolase domain-containing protein [Bacteroidales bacterium]
MNHPVRSVKWCHTIACLFVALLVMLLYPGNATAVNGTAFREQLQEYLSVVAGGERIKGLSAVLVGAGDEPWFFNLGYADLEQEVPADKHTVYPIASLTKMFTAIAVMQLVEEGMLELNDPVVSHLPEFSIKSRFTGGVDITVKHLLSHYAGLPRDLYKGLMTEVPSERPDLLDYLSGQYAAFPPGHKYVYSNLSYELLGLMLESLSGQQFEDFLFQRVLLPLDMQASGFYADVNDHTGPAQAYVQALDVAFEEMPSMLRAAGGLYSSASDMALLLQWIMERGKHPPYVSEWLFNKMFADQKTEDALDVGFESGWSWVLEHYHYEDDERATFAYQIGSTLHYNAVMAVAPDEGLGIVILCNTGGVIDVMTEMARMIILSAIEETTGKSLHAPHTPTLIPEAEFTEADALNVQGHYILQNEVISINYQEGAVIFTSGGQSFRALFHEDGWFSLGDDLRFNVVAWEETKVLIISRFGRTFPAGTDVSGKYLLPGDIFSYLGSYTLYGVNDQWEEVMYRQADLLLEEGLLQLRLWLSSHQQTIFGYQVAHFNLIPKSGSEAVIAGFGMYKGETVFWGSDEKGPYVRFSGLEFR